MFQKLLSLTVSFLLFSAATSVLVVGQSESDDAKEGLRYAQKQLMERFELKESQLEGMKYALNAFPTEGTDEIWVVEYYPSEREKYRVEFRHPSYELELCALYIDGMMKHTPNTFVLGSSFPSSPQNTVSRIMACTMAWDYMKSLYNFSEITYPMFSFVAFENQDDGAFYVAISALYDKQFPCGTYSFVIDAKDGELLSHSWNMEEQYREQKESGMINEEGVWGSEECNAYAADYYQ